MTDKVQKTHEVMKRKLKSPPPSLTLCRQRTEQNSNAV